jgi:5-methylcytosine-specific restriction enzyme A
MLLGVLGITLVIECLGSVIVVETFQSYAYKKVVDWSVLNQGFSIPVTYQLIFKDKIKELYKKGTRVDIKLLLEGNIYDAKLVNQSFDEKKYSGHKDVVQIRYSPSSELSNKLRSMFSFSYNLLEEQRSSPEHRKKASIRIPQEEREYLAIYTTEFSNIFYAECITKQDMELEKYHIISYKEEELEFGLNYVSLDPSARIEERQVNAKIRRLNRSISENLKAVYDHKCQICNENFSIKYGCNIAEAHHIEHFSKSMNNDASNIIILCPNHHRVVHKAQPVLDRKKLVLSYESGLVERVVLNVHL